MVIFSIAIALCLGALYEKNRQIDNKRSHEMCYRLIALELPDITSHIDSTYSIDPDKFHELVIKEKKNKGLGSILNVNSRK